MGRVHRSAGRFYMKTKNGEAELLYAKSAGVMSIYHTFVPENERGKEIAEVLTKAAFSYAIKNGFKIRADCSYAQHFAMTHKEIRKYTL